MNKSNFIIITLITGIVSFLCLNTYGIHPGFVWTISLIIALSIAWFTRKITFLLRSSDLILVGLFLAIIFLPFISKKETESFEKRPLAPEPTFNPQFVWGFFFEFQKYYEDRFAFRNKMVENYSKTKLKVFNSSPLPSLVGIGKENWLFYTKPLLIEESQKPFTRQELKQIQLNLRLITAWLKEHQISYYYLLLPYKQRIYPEFQSPLIAHNFQFSKMDQLYNEIKNDSLIHCIDVRQNLLDGKKKLPTYLKTDTHWTEWGSYLAYVEVFNQISKEFPTLKPLGIEEFKIDTQLTGEGDLQLMLGLKNDIMYDYHKITPKHAPEIVIIDSSKTANPTSKYSIRELKDKKTGLKIFVVRDSFTEYLRKFITPHFDRSFYAWMPIMPATKIIEEKPNLVLQEMLEQFIHHTLELPVEIQQDTAFLKRNLKKLAP